MSDAPHHKLIGNGRIVLIADDNPRSRELLRTVLTNDGYRVLEYNNGKDAVAGAKQYDPALIFLDLKMPGLDGFGTLAALKELPQCAKTPTVAFTASAMQGDRERILAEGFTEYLPKPIHLSELRQVLGRLLGTSG